MAYQKPDNKKKGSGTGGRKGKKSDKRLAQMGSQPLHPVVSSKDVRKKSRVRGGNVKVQMKKISYINVVSEGKTTKAKIVKVLESNNRDYIRANIVTKGALVETDKFPKVKITNRPTQDGVTNGVVVIN